MVQTREPFTMANTASCHMMPLSYSATCSLCTEILCASCDLAMPQGKCQSERAQSHETVAVSPGLQVELVTPLHPKSQEFRRAVKLS